MPYIKDIRVRVKRSYTSVVMLVIKVRECTVILYWNRRPPLVLNQVKKLYMSCNRKCIFVHANVHVYVFCGGCMVQFVHMFNGLVRADCV